MPENNREKLRTVLSEFKELGLSQRAAATLSDLNIQVLNECINGKRKTTPRTLRRAQRALRKHKNNVTTLPHENITWIRRCYVLLCSILGGNNFENLKKLLVEQPSRRAAKDRTWLEASAIRRKAIYILNTEFSIDQAHIAKALSMSPAGVCLALKDVEDMRDDGGELDQKLNEIASVFEAASL